MATTDNKTTSEKPRTVRVFMLDFSSHTADLLFAISNGVLIFGAAAVLIGTIGAFIMTGVREQFSNERISANEAETAEARRQTASLEKEAVNARIEQERLKAANLALEQQIQPRIITVDLANELVAISRRHAGKSIAIASYALDIESAMLGEQLIRLFRADGISFKDRRMNQSALGSLAFGISVAGTDALFANEIRNAFRSAGFKAVTDQPPPPASGISLGDPNSPAPVNLFLGIKPL